MDVKLLVGGRIEKKVGRIIGGWGSEKVEIFLMEKEYEKK